MVAVRSVVVACTALAVCGAAVAQPSEAKDVVGSTAFCLFQVPTDDPARQRWINLGIVQYVETSQNELRIVFGGGNFGSGHELRIVYAGYDDVQAQLERMRQTAAACMGRPAATN